VVVKAQRIGNIPGRRLPHCTASSKIEIIIALFSNKYFSLKVFAHMRDIKQVRVV